MAWIFLNDAFISVVSDPTKPGNLLVRARAKGDLMRLFPSYREHKTPFRDYAYRISVPKAEVAAVIARRVLGIDYGNFKNSVEEHDRHTAYARVWTAMYGFQLGRERQAQDADSDFWGGMEEFDRTPLPFHETLEPEPKGPKKAKQKRTARVRPCQNEGKDSPRRKR